jgi:hypothetical protein
MGFIAATDHRCFMGGGLLLTWGMLAGCPFDVTGIVAPGAALPLVLFNMTIVAVTLHASTWTCAHTPSAVAILVWTATILVVTRVLVFGFVPPLGLVVGVAALRRAIPPARATLGLTVAVTIATFAGVGPFMLTESRGLSASGGFNVFEEMPMFEVVVMYGSAVVLAGAVLCRPLRHANPLCTMAVSTPIALGVSLTVGFAGHLNPEVGSVGSLAGLNFYHTVGLFVASCMLFVVLLLMLAFTTHGLAFDALTLMAVTGVGTVARQWVGLGCAPSAVQVAGVGLLGLATLGLGWFHRLDARVAASGHVLLPATCDADADADVDTALEEAPDTRPFFACEACALDARIATAEKTAASATFAVAATREWAAGQAPAPVPPCAV